jgi:hypothetical protein
MAAVLETRLLQAQSEAMALLISILVSDELACRSKRLLERRHKQAQFRGYWITSTSSSIQR